MSKFEHSAPQQISILRLITRMNVGGPARQANLLTKALAEDLPTLLAAGRPPAYEGELIDPDVSIHYVPFVRPVRPIADLHALRSVQRILQHENAPLVHTHMAKAGAIGRAAARTRSTPPRLVHTYHGHVLRGYFSGPHQRVFVELERRLARFTDALITVSPEIRDELLDLGIGTEAQYHVIPLGFDLEPFLAINGPSNRLRSALGLDQAVPLLGIIGRLVAIKDHQTLFKALASLPDVHLAVLGDGELRSNLEAVAQSLGIGARVHFTGWWADIPAALADLDVVVLTSRNEGTPVALIESLASRRPVVATDVGGVRHVVQHGQTGWLCEVGDIAGLIDLLSRALTERRLADHLATEGRRRVTHHFGQERLVTEHRELYRQLLRS